VGSFFFCQISDTLHVTVSCNTSAVSVLVRPTCSAVHALSYALITIAIRLGYDYDPTTTYRSRLLPFDAIRREQKMNMSIIRRSRIAVESQL